MTMKLLLFLLIFLDPVECVSYHPRQDYKLHVDSGVRNFIVNASTLFSETILHRGIYLCIENQLGPNVSIHLYDYIKNDYTQILELEDDLTVIGKSSVTDWSLVIENGLKISVITNSTGFLIFKKCRRDLLTTLDNKISSVLRPYQSYEYAIHVPFDISQNKNVTKYVDFSTILPRRVLAGNNWQIKAFCMNATIMGNIKVHMSRCKSSAQFSMELNATNERQLARYWNEFILLDEKCPIHEETLPDHLWMNFESGNHTGLGEVIIYDCQHTWRRNEKGEEVVEIIPDIRPLESAVWSFDYVVLPFRQNVYFAPIKHMIDTALITRSEIQLSLILDSPHVISFSSCYNSEKYLIKVDSPKRIMNMTRDDLQVLSDFSNVLNCSEEKAHHGVYMNIGADEKKVIGSAIFQLIGTPNVQTPEGKLFNDAQTTVAFNIKKGNWISRNVNLQAIIRQGVNNIHVELSQMFNCTGLIQLYISRCEFSPKLKLFGPMKMGSAAFNRETVEYISGLFNYTSCLNDYQDKRYEYRTKDKYGIYFHIEALEDSIGYTAIYESFKAKLVYHEVINEEYIEGERGTSTLSRFRIFKPSEVSAEIAITHLLDRTRTKPPVSLRLYVTAPAPLEFSFSQCRSETKRDWKKLGSNLNESVVGWYTFDSEGVDLIRGYSDSLNCPGKRLPLLFLHVKTGKRNHVNFEFAIVNGTDLNVVQSCETAEKLKIQATELYNRIVFGLIQITSVVIIILGAWSVLFIKKKIQEVKKQKVNQIELTSVLPFEVINREEILIDY